MRILNVSEHRFDIAMGSEIENMQQANHHFNNTTVSEREILRQANDAFARDLIPAMTFVALLMVVGIVGNLLVCFVFGFRLRMRTQHFLILTLAVFDLLSCFVAMPTEIADMRYSLMFGSEFACRLLKLTTVFTSMASSFTLVVIAVDRYIKICRPLHHQMSLRHTKMALVVVLLAACVFTFPSAVLAGNKTMNTTIYGEDISIYSCSTDGSMPESRFPLIYYAILFLGFISLVVVLSVLYGRIWKTIRSHKRRMSVVASINSPLSAASSRTKLTSLSSSVSSSSLSVPTVIIADTTKTTNSSLNTTMDTPDSYSSNSEENADISSMKTRKSTTNSSSRKHENSTNTSSEKGHKTSTKTPSTKTENSNSPSVKSHTTTNKTHSTKTENTANSPAVKTLKTLNNPHSVKTHKTTVIALAVTVVFFFSFIPFFGIVIARGVGGEFGYQLSGAELVSLNIFIRFPFLNSVANPFIYSALNPSFRSECSRLFRCGFRSACCGAQV